jgi:uncharacterized membrane protein YeaQ/YmgE (transglycosylase-associated protein family)
LLGFLIALAVAAILGSIGARLAGREPMGCLLSIVLGFIGALVGRWLSDVFDLGDPFTITVGGQTFPLLWSVVGAALFVAVLNLLSGRGLRG